jgi:hypothetical protein
MTDIKTLYAMTKKAAEGANDALKAGSYATYPTYIREYNRLAPLVVTQCGEEARLSFGIISLGKQLNPADALVPMWATYLSSAAVLLALLLKNVL